MDRLLQDDFSLNAESISKAVNEADKYLSGLSIDHKDALRLKLALEETLLKYRDSLPEDTRFQLRFSDFFGSFRITLRIYGKSYDPFVAESSGITVMGSLKAHSETLDMSWRYRGDSNLVTFTVAAKRKINLITAILIGIVCGIGAGHIVKAFSPEAATVIATRIIAPLAGAYTGLLCVMATLLCFGAISLGIVRMGDISTFSTVGKKMINSFLFVSFVLTLLNTAWLVPGMTFGMSASLSLAFFDFWNLVLDFVPDNILSPILEFNSVHIIIVAGMFGVAMLKMGKKADRLTETFDEVNTVAILSNTYLNRFIPIYVGLMICSQILTDQRELLLSYGRLILIVAIGEIVTVLIYTLVVCIRLRVGVRTFVRKLLPSFMISITTASVGAAFITIINDLIGGLGVDKDFAPLSFNLGGILFRPGYCIVFTTCSLFAANMVGIHVTWSWILAAFLLSFVLSVATPPVIGGTTVCFSLLFSQLGIKTEALAVIISINAVLEFLTVAVNNYCLECQTALLAYHFRKIDLKTLRSYEP